MSIVSKEQIEAKIRELIAGEESSLDQLSLDDILLADDDEGIDLKTLFIELGAIQTEFKQMNRIEGNRLETLKEHFDEERNSKQQLLENINALVSKVEYSEQKSVLLSVLEIKDFLETFNKALPLVFKKNNAISSLVTKLVAKQAFNYVNENVNLTLKKIDQLLDRTSVHPILSDNVTFNPSTMIAIETLNDNNSPDLKVLETREKGYLHHEKVLRLAKVKVNKIESAE